MANQLQRSKRIDVLDIIRGFAVMGIFIVNFPEMVGSGIYFTDAATGADAGTRFFFDLFIQTKFYAIFAFLFGVGFYLFMRSAEQRGLAAKKLMTRRLLLLFLAGIAHVVLLWFGDVLHTYALCGLLLLLFYKRSTKTILTWSIALLSIYLAFTWLGHLATASMPEGSVSVIMDHVPNMRERVEFFLQMGIANNLLMLFDVLGLSLLGLYAGRKGWFEKAAQHMTIVRNVQWITLVLTGLFFIPMVNVYLASPGVYQSVDVLLYTHLTGKTLSVFYVCTLLRLAHHYGAKSFDGLASLGRMAFTNYLMHSAIGLIVLRVIWKGAGEDPLWMGAVFCAAVLVLQVLFSKWWLRRYQLGPLEWLWRMGTYGRHTPLRRAESRAGNESS